MSELWEKFIDLGPNWRERQAFSASLDTARKKIEKELAVLNDDLERVNKDWDGLQRKKKYRNCGFAIDVYKMILREIAQKEKQWADILEGKLP